MPSTDLVVFAGSAEDAPRARTTALRMAENFMRLWFLIVLPVIVMSVIGVLVAQRSPAEYLGSATLSTSANPLIGAQEIRGLSGNARESPADATARVINERLGTDAFTAGVAERAGLQGAVDRGLLTYDDIRERVTLFPTGTSLVDIEARWSDPESALRLIEATLDEYTSILMTTVSGDAQWAVEFYENRRADAVVTAQEAADALNTFADEVGGTPEALSLANELAIERLNARLSAANAAIDVADSAIEDARLTVVRAQSEAGGSIQVVDAPNSTFEPESAVIRKAITVVGFLFLGLLMALGLLTLSTNLDRSVRSAADIEAAGGGVTVAAVPEIQSLRERTGMRRVLGAVASAPGRMFGRSQQAV